MTPEGCRALRRALLASATLLTVAPLAHAQQTRDYASVTDARLANPEPENWLQYRGNYAGWGYSPLDKINADNVSDLIPAWSFSTGLDEGHQAPPIVNDGMMFVTTPQNNVIALDAASGEVLWRYRRELPLELFQLHPTNRGVALYGDKVFMATADACVVALEAASGELAWEGCVADWRDGYYMTLSPLAADGKVVVGVSGGEFGIRGFITAFDAETGAEAWKTYTIPGPGEPGHDTWTGDTWKTGGAPVWIQGSYDPESNLAYFGTGNGGPWMPDARPGDNLYATSVIAVDLADGAIKGHHQYHWNDAWDWDEVTTPILVDIERDGETVPAAVHAGRNGYLWILERKPDGAMGFVDAKAYVKQNVFESIDPETGRPSYSEAHTPGVGKSVTFCPGLWGGKDWPPEAYNPDTGLLYIPTNDNLCSELGGVEVGAHEPGDFYIGVPLDEILTSLRATDDVDTSQPFEIGSIQAWDLAKGEMVWEHPFMDQANWGPILTTGGGLVFAGGTPDRMFRALDAETGEELWSMKLNSGVIGVPSTFMVDGEQYVSVQAGWGVDANRMLNGLSPILRERQSSQGVPQGGVIWTFKVRQATAATDAPSERAALGEVRP